MLLDMNPPTEPEREPRHFARACPSHGYLLDDAMRCPSGCQIPEHDKDVPVGTLLWRVVDLETGLEHSSVYATHERTERASGKRESTTRVEDSPYFRCVDVAPKIAGRCAAGFSPNALTSRAAMSREAASTSEAAQRKRAWLHRIGVRP